MPGLYYKDSFMNDHFSRISSLIIRHMEAEPLSGEEQKELDDWLTASPQHRQLFSQLTDPAYVRQELEKMFDYDPQSGWQKIQSAYPSQAGMAPVQRSPRWKYWVAAAAIFAAIITAALFVVYRPGKTDQVAEKKPAKQASDIAAPAISKATITLQNGSRIAIDSTNTGTMALLGKTAIQKTGQGQILYTGNDAGILPEFNTLTNPRGSRVIQLILSDGTKVWLNAETEIRYPVVFSGASREVEMNGEAYFEVAKDAAKPFMVKSNGVTVQVTGTHFNVNAYKDEASLNVTLLEGAVKVSQANHTVDLAPGEQAQVSNSIKIDKQVNTEQVMAWKNGMFIFNGTDIYTAMRQLSRWYDVDVHFKQKISENFYGDISRDKNISGVLNMLETTGSVHFKTIGNMVEVDK